MKGVVFHKHNGNIKIKIVVDNKGNNAIMETLEEKAQRRGFNWLKGKKQIKELVKGKNIRRNFKKAQICR